MSNTGHESDKQCDFIPVVNSPLVIAAEMFEYTALLWMIIYFNYNVFCIFYVNGLVQTVATCTGHQCFI